MLSDFRHTEAAAGSTDEVTVREFQTGDAEAVRRLNGLILGPDRSGSWDEYIEQFLAVSRLQVMVLPSWGSQVAEVDGEVVGFILAQRQTAGYGLPTGVRIVALAVAPAFRQRGIGRKLVQALEAHCRDHGVKTIYSVVKEDDERDAAFLEACGFEPARVKVFARTIPGA